MPKIVDPPSVEKSDSGLPTLKPLELRTYLQIGIGPCYTILSSSLFLIQNVSLSVGQVEGDSSPVPFTIEWIPDVLPQSKFGEVSFHFRFGHQRHNGNKRSMSNGVASQPNSLRSSSPRRKKVKMTIPVALKASPVASPVVSSEVPPSLPSEVLDSSKEGEPLQNLRLDFDGVVPLLSNSEFQELTNSVP